MRFLVALLLLCSQLFGPFDRVYADATCVVLDPGHGGLDPGAVAEDGIYEKTLNLRLARQVKNFLEAAGIEVVLTRSTDGACPALIERAVIANEKSADLFVSLHANSDLHPSCEGIELYYYPGSCQGEAIARITKRVIDDKGTLASCRVKPSSYLVLEKTAMPAVLVEAGYLSNATERMRLLDAFYRRQLAQAVAEGIIIHLHSTINYR